MLEIKALETLFVDNAKSLAEILECVGARVFNMVAPAGAAYPYAVFQVIPLDDNFGQARTTIQTVCLVDFKIYSEIPPPASVDLAVDALKEFYRSRIAAFDQDGFRVSIRHERPLSLIVPGARADNKILMRGSTYKAWISPA